MKRLRVSCCIKVLLIFLGIILMQVFASAVYIFGFIFIKVFKGGSYTDVMADISAILTMDTAQATIWISGISALLSMLWCLVLYLKSSWRVKNMDYRKVFTPGNIIGIFTAGTGGCITVTILLSVIMSLFPSAFKSYNELMSNLDSDGGLPVLIFVLLIGPASEEIIFRGAIFDRLHLAFPFWIANALQAFLFGVYHMNIIQGIYAFLLGMLLGMVVYSTGSILCSIATHIIFNSTTYILQFIAGSGSVILSFILIAIVILSFFMLVYSLIYFIKECQEKYYLEKKLNL